MHAPAANRTTATPTIGRVRNRLGFVVSCLMRIVLWSVIATGAVACGADTVTASVGGYNHMPNRAILSFSVDKASGANLAPESGETGSMCCAALPRRWHPGMKALVTWTYGSRYPAEPPSFEALVDIPEYPDKRAGSVQVHFYANHQVKIVVSRYGIEHPRYPMSAKDKLPWETSRQLIEYEKQGTLPE